MNKHETEYLIKMVTRNYCNEVIESHTLAKCYSANLARQIKDMLDMKDMYKDGNVSIEIVSMPYI